LTKIQRFEMPKLRISIFFQLHYVIIIVTKTKTVKIWNFLRFKHLPDKPLKSEQNNHNCEEFNAGRNSGFCVLTIAIAKVLIKH